MFKRETNTQKNWNDYFQNEKPSASINIPPIILTIVILCVTAMIIYFAGNSEPETISTNNFTNINSNRDGLVMSQSIGMMEAMFTEDISIYTVEELQYMIEAIEMVDLSDEYNTFRQRMIDKVNHYIDYLKTGKDSDLASYNSIDFYDELALAFDDAGVKYKFEDGKIDYEYLSY